MCRHGGTTDNECFEGCGTGNQGPKSDKTCPNISWGGNCKIYQLAPRHGPTFSILRFRANVRLGITDTGRFGGNFCGEGAKTEPTDVMAGPQDKNEGQVQ